MRHTLEARERALVAGSSYAPKFGYVIAMVVAAVLMRSPSARASDVPPEQIRTTAEMEAAINQQVARYEPAVLAVRRTKAALPPLQAAHQQMLTENMPWWERKADYKGRLSQLDEHERLRAITELAPELARQEAELLRRKQSLEAAGRPMPAEETRSWELYRSVKAEVDKAQRELPRARPAWVPSGTDVAAFRATLAQEFERFTAQLRPRQEEMDRRAAALSAAAYAATRAQQDAIEVRRRYLVLRHELQRRLAPAYVSEVKLRAPLDPRGNEATYYHAVIDNPETEGLNPGTVAMMAAMPAVDAEVLRALDEFREAERRFVSVSAQWQRKNDLYIVITRDEYILNTGLEL
ncbi:MAG TPA: hypothetical protein VM029_00435, partial [Opitutaceae bacterium]|nr:hypothetical protein [Opitutaceae bacterium]